MMTWTFQHVHIEFGFIMLNEHGSGGRFIHVRDMRHNQVIRGSTTSDLVVEVMLQVRVLLIFDH